MGYRYNASACVHLRNVAVPVALHKPIRLDPGSHHGNVSAFPQINIDGTPGPCHYHPMAKPTKINVEVPPDIYVRVKVAAAQRRTTIKDAMNEACLLWLEKAEGKPSQKDHS